MTHIRHIFLKRAFTASMLLLASIAVTPAMAAPVIFAFTGVVTNVSGSLNPPFNTTQTLSGFYTFNSSTPDSVANLNRGQYNGAVTGLTVNLGPYTATLGNSGTNFIQIRDGGSDRYTMQAGLTGPLVPGTDFSPLNFRIELRDSTGLAFNNDSLPTTPPDLSSFNTETWRIVFEGADGRATIRGTLSTLTAVPLPAAVILFGVGLVALVGLGAGSWRQKKNSFA